MTPEQRYDRLERIVKLMIKAGLRARRQSREQDDKINMIINLQIENEQRFAKHEQRLGKLSEENERKFAKLTESQARSDRRLDSLIEAIHNEWKGNSSAEH